MKFGVAQPVTRKEDSALLHGAGRYVADYTPKGVLAAAMLRSPHAHARFRITDVARARALAGVKLVLTADDIGELGPLPCVAIPPGLTVEAPPYPVLANGEARHVGDIVAFVVSVITLSVIPAFGNDDRGGRFIQIRRRASCSYER